jgi:hypothetical protein
MNRSDYSKAAALVEVYYHVVLDELTEEILGTENAVPCLGKDTDKILQSYSNKLWYITTCLDQLRYAASKPKRKPAQVARFDCTHSNVTDRLSSWLSVTAAIRNSATLVVRIDQFLGCVV